MTLCEDEVMVRRGATAKMYSPMTAQYFVGLRDVRACRKVVIVSVVIYSDTLAIDSALWQQLAHQHRSNY